MNRITPMNKIKIILISFGLLVGAIFSTIIDYFLVSIFNNQLLVYSSFLIVGFIVGVFGYFIVKIVLNRIHIKYKEIIKSKLDLSVDNINNYKTDYLIDMQKEFEILLDEISQHKKNEAERLRKLVITDELTGLYNRRYLYEYINTEVKNSDNEIGILFCDIDYFKSINDSFGHSIGDSVIKLIASEMKEFIGLNGTIFRYGGEEFVVLLENHSLQQTTNMAERLRLQIKNIAIMPCCNEERFVTASIGISHYPSDGLELELLLDKSDKAMYNAKKNGRDQCCIFKFN